MKLIDMSDKEILEKVTPMAVHTENAWNEKDYEKFCQYLFIEQEHDFTSENFYEQIESNYDRLGKHTVKDFVMLHRNPENIVVMWELGIENRSEPGLIVYKFKDHENKIAISSCILHD